MQYSKPAFMENFSLQGNLHSYSFANTMHINSARFKYAGIDLNIFRQLLIDISIDNSQTWLL